MPKDNPIPRVKIAPPPPELPTLGKLSPEQISFIGRTNYVAALEEKRFVFGIKRSDRAHHIYVIGKSNTGKSKLVEIMIRQDIAYGYSNCLFDPQGDIISSLLNFVPENKTQNVIVIDPCFSGTPFLFNPFFVKNNFRHEFIDGLTNIFKSLSDHSWSSHIEHIFRLACLAILDNPRENLEGAIKLLTDETFRETVSQNIKDESVRKFWYEDFLTWRKKFDREALTPLVNQLSKYMFNPCLKQSFGPTENSINLEELIANRKTILVNLSKNKLGDNGSKILGSIILLKIKEARSAPLQKMGDCFYLYLDEFAGLEPKLIENLLSESKSCGISVTLTHQYLNQIDHNHHSAILNNVGNIIVFRLAGEDALKLKPEMAPVFDVKDMINLGMQQFCIKMTIDGEVHDPFSGETLTVTDAPQQSFSDKIKFNPENSINT